MGPPAAFQTGFLHLGKTNIALLSAILLPEGVSNAERGVLSPHGLVQFCEHPEDVRICNPRKYLLEQATAKMAGDARLWDAYNYLTQHDDSDHSRSHVWGKVDRIVALRVGEKLFAPQVGIKGLSFMRLVPSW